ncbi:MAG TPA: type II toxin-antitoxin system RelE/ParE family toxin [Acidobacteriaceae bacterium]
MKPIQISRAAADDLLHIAYFLESESGSSSLADRFLSAAASAIDLIAMYPFAGRARPTLPNFPQLRSLGVDRPFAKYLIFYQPSVSSTLVIRVLHGAQDFGPILHIDPERDA